MTPYHHPSDEWLVSYAAGGLDEGQSLLVASHLTLCPRCRNVADEAEALGGALLDGMEPTDLDDGLLERIMTRLDGAGAEPEATTIAPDTGDGVLPAPLVRYLGTKGNVDDLPWKRVTSGVWQVPVHEGQNGGRVRLYRFAPETVVPDHGHGGQELSIVLGGGYWDENGSFARGDFSEIAEGLVHQPIADAGSDCITLTANARPIRPTNFLKRLFLPFIH